MARRPPFRPTRIRLGGPSPSRRPRPDHHVEVHPDGWAVRAEGDTEPSFVGPNRNEAFVWATETARRQRGRVIVHRTDGAVAATIDLSGVG